MSATRKSKGSASSDQGARVETPNIKSLRDEYDQADRFCQEVQSFVEAAGIPALNELRNAGFHLLRSIDDSGQVINTSEMIRAVNHAKRASYEAAEAGILLALDKIAIFKFDFKDVPVTGVIQDYIAHLETAERAKLSLIESRSAREDRIDDYLVRIATFRELKGVCLRLDVARPELNKEKNRGVTEARRFILNTALTVLGIAVTIALAVVFAGG